eukprot:GDKI01002721.1.p1 GENE.GDKI01002721.1~~GDKI01002721.1.p1  ORF type:complete len:436 (-),score=110.11 GDKI01002721.1:288-1595(-)
MPRFRSASEAEMAYMTRQGMLYAFRMWYTLQAPRRPLYKWVTGSVCMAHVNVSWLMLLLLCQGTLAHGTTAQCVVVPLLVLSVLLLLYYLACIGAGLYFLVQTQIFEIWRKILLNLQNLLACVLLVTWFSLLLSYTALPAETSLVFCCSPLFLLLGLGVFQAIVVRGDHALQNFLLFTCLLVASVFFALRADGVLTDTWAMSQWPAYVLGGFLLFVGGWDMAETVMQPVAKRQLDKKNSDVVVPPIQNNGSSSVGKAEGSGAGLTQRAASGAHPADGQKTDTASKPNSRRGSADTAVSLGHKSREWSEDAEGDVLPLLGLPPHVESVVATHSSQLPVWLAPLWQCVCVMLGCVTFLSFCFMAQDSRFTLAADRGMEADQYLQGTAVRLFISLLGVWLTCISPIAVDWAGGVLERSFFRYLVCCMEVTEDETPLVS